jgi:uncharacterized membrane protein
MTFAVASVDETGYRIVLILHILAVIVALAPVIAHQVMIAQAKSSLDSTARDAVFGFMATNTQKIYGSAMVVAGLLGFALVGMSDKTYELSEGWLITAAIIWVAMTGIMHGVMSQNERKLAAGDEVAAKMVQAGGQALTVLTVVMVYLMAFQPGH